MKNYLIILLLITLSACQTKTATKNEVKSQYEANWESLQKHQTPEWFKDAKFGIYFHWGVYSYMGKGEWYSRQMYEDKDKGWNHWLREHHLNTYGDSVHYHDFIPEFTAEHFDADDWAQLFKKSGAQFAGPVAEHCDNFSNWDSKVNKYNTVNYGPKRDLVGELEKAIKGQDLKFVTTFHHSWEWAWYNRWSGYIDTTDVEFDEFYGEWTAPETFGKMSAGFAASGQGSHNIDPKYAPSRKFVDTWKEKVYEVVDRYQPDLLWFDSRVFVIPEKDRQEMVAHYYNKEQEWNKELVLTYKNNDLPKGVGVIDLEKGRMDEKTEFPWLTDDSYAWHGWSWRADLDLKTPDVIITELVDIVSKNGCLLLNITPTHDGKIPKEMRTGLLEVGEWLKTNGEAVFNTRPFVTYGEGVTKLKKNHFGGVQGFGINYQAKDFRFTTNGENLYITQLAMPKGGEDFILHSFATDSVASGYTINQVELLGSDEKIKWSQSDKGLSITAPNTFPNDKALVYKLNIKQ
ncbi:alpha-L-fucosidase [Labilibacter marinus]|uniref:alpha-L-fucosidase n=1 Tax=Labilibacter marinus TaxID=1477105 RepID=UPI00094F4DED|nr:alpha-L-fucosidase [Labilibacter marinus]